MREYLYNLATDRSKGLLAGILKFFLLLLSFIYGLAVRALILFYRLRPRRLNCRLISVGNITMGGTGKTSLVEYIGRYLHSQGRKTAILSRGYKRRITKDEGRTTNDELRTTNYEDMGDEPYMLSQKLAGIPVIVGKNRINSAKKAIREYGADTLILDDGLQQWRIKKDMEIVTIDATNPFGNAHLIPRGILRQPLSSLKRVDIFVLTKVNLARDAALTKEILRKINPRSLIFEAEHVPEAFCSIHNWQEAFTLESLRNKTAVLFCGIGDPGSFKKLILSVGIKVILFLSFPDHHGYSQAEFENILRQAKEEGADAVITTEKDASRLSQLPVAGPQLPVLALRIRLKIIKDEKGFNNRLLRLFTA